MVMESCACTLHTSLLLSQVLLYSPDILSPLLVLCTREEQPEIPFALKENWDYLVYCSSPVPAQTWQGWGALL